MTLRMGDGPVDNIPAGLDAYAGYVNRSGIGVTFPPLVAKYPNALHLSITTDGIAAMCADVESGAMSHWSGYTYGYCAVSNANNMIREYGRPRKLWLAHYDPHIGAHICSPECWSGLITTADGTQWTDHGNVWDESLLADNFFELQPNPSPSTQGENMIAYDPGSKSGSWALGPDGGIFTADGSAFLGSMAGNRFNWQAVGTLDGIAPWWDGSGWGYKVALHTNQPGQFTYYRFSSNGSAKSALGVEQVTDHADAIAAAQDTTRWSPNTAGTVEAK